MGGRAWEEAHGRQRMQSCVAIGRDLDESTVAHSDTKINWPIKSDLENDIQVGITMNI